MNSKDGKGLEHFITEAWEFTLFKRDYKGKCSIYTKIHVYKIARSELEIGRAIWAKVQEQPFSDSNGSKNTWAVQRQILLNIWTRIVWCGFLPWQRPWFDYLKVSSYFCAIRIVKKKLLINSVNAIFTIGFTIKVISIFTHNGQATSSWQMQFCILLFRKPCGCLSKLTRLTGEGFLKVAIDVS